MTKDHHLRPPLAEAQWQKIKKALEDVGVVADAVVIEIMTYDGAIKYSLRGRLPFMADLCNMTAEAQKLTPKKLAADLGDTIKLAKQLHERLRFRSIAESRRKQAELQELIRLLEQRRNEASAMGSSTGKSNATGHNLFWKELLQVWNANVSRRTNSRNKKLERFLIACSEPFFPKEKIDGAISAFVERHALSSK